MIKFTFIFIILYWLILKPNSDRAVNIYVSVCSLLFILMIGLRNEAIFGDTFGYVFRFKQLGDISIDTLLDHWDKDRLFWILAYYLHPLIGGNYTIWLMMMAIAIIYPISVLIRKFSVEPMYSWLVLFFIGFVLFFMAGMRQTMAMSLTLLGFYYLIDDNRFRRNSVLRFVTCVAIASCFHSSALICLAAPLIIRPFNVKSLIVYSIALVLCLIAGRFIMGSVTHLIAQQDQRYLVYGEMMQGSSATYFFQQFILLVPSLAVLRNRYNERFVSLLCHFSVIGLLLVSLSPVVAEMFRMSFYFSWANILLFPMALRTIRERSRLIPLIFLLFFIVYLVFINKTAWSPYYFWFEDTSNIIKTYNITELYF